ncbi:class II aldolase/adducin family protein [Alcaligenes sp. SDU_A2]|uniref:class II aldolase/adducin family protein n=1 Tax=Alcaligenes sp. SDU_A2 TaxID=3136634 RepID=UPI002B64098B|nr:class II aldolase/adducin family protein [Alcaligenes sp.]HRL27247.1 class II aldolase/adducin family protein [Alcaligenes sp.]
MSESCALTPDIQAIYAARPKNCSQAEWRARVNLAACYRLAARQGWDDIIYTHISLRLPGRDDVFLINPFGLRFDEICASNLLLIDLQGKVVDGTDRRANPSGFAIHGAVHRARKDAHCVIHLHTDATIAVSALQCGLLPLSQHAMRFWNDIAYHDYAGLAFSRQEQEQLVLELGSHPAMLLRNHGSLTCGRTVAEAYILMDTLERACRIQLSAMSTGAELHVPAPDVLAQTHRQLLPGSQPEGLLEWPALLRRLQQSDPDFCL